jgi:peptide/nickel transport system substrate-binding protein
LIGGIVKHIGQGIFIALILMVLALAGCGGNGKETSKPAAGEEKTQKKADQNQMNPQPRDGVQQGGRLVWPIDHVPANFNYGQIDGTVLDGAFIINAVMPMIFNFDASATPTYNPDYLAGEPKLVNSPKQVVTYELNPKAIWYDGTPITADDYIAQWKASNGTNHA